MVSPGQLHLHIKLSTDQSNFLFSKKTGRTSRSMLMVEKEYALNIKGALNYAPLATTCDVVGQHRIDPRMEDDPHIGRKEVY